MSKSKYLNEVSVDPQILGLSVLLSPFAAHINGSRLDMFNSHCSQFQIIEGAEFPDIFTGYESKIGKYEKNSCEILEETDIEVLEVIPKFDSITDIKLQQNNSSSIVVFKRFSDNKIDYFEISKFTTCSDGYGYFNKFLNINQLHKNNIVPKGTKIYTSPIHDGKKYKMGVNANVAFMTLTGTIEDSFLISRSLAEKLTPTGFKELSIMINYNDTSASTSTFTKINKVFDKAPLNIYGSDEEYKIIPDIGDTIREDGIVFALREFTDKHIITNLHQESLTNINKLLDQCYYGKAGAEVVDIDVYIDPVLSTMLPDMFNQLKKYHECKIKQYKRIVETYKQYKNKYEFSNKFITLVTRAMSYLTGQKTYKNSKSKILLTDKNKPFDIIINIKYAYKIPVNGGFKLTGRDGAKGVCQIIDDEFMPVDDHGFRADIVIDPASVIKRTNIGQSIEQYINRISEIVRRNLETSNDTVENKFEYLVSYISYINKEYGNVIRSSIRSESKQKEFIDYVIKEGIKINIIPYQENINSLLIKQLDGLYDSRITPVTFKLRDPVTDTIKTVRSKYPVCIGKKYIYLLYIMPEISSVGAGYVNQYGIPAKPSYIGKVSYPIKQSCIRFGEDETRMMMSTCGPELMVRLRTLTGTSLVGIEKTIETILEAESPSNIDYIPITNQELLDTDSILNIVQTIFNSFGVDIRNTKATQEDFNYYQRSISCCQIEEKDDDEIEEEIFEEEIDDENEEN